jgi:hypothetical protein
LAARRMRTSRQGDPSSIEKCQVQLDTSKNAGLDAA